MATWCSAHDLPVADRRFRGLGPLREERRICVGGARIPGPGTPCRSGIDTQCIDLGGSRALSSSGANSLTAAGTSPTGAIASGVAMTWPHHAREGVNDSPRRVAVTPLGVVPSSCVSFRNTLPWLQAARRCRFAASLARCAFRRNALVVCLVEGRPWKDEPPTTPSRERARCLGSAVSLRIVHCAPAPRRDGADSRQAHVEPCRPPDWPASSAGLRV